ncbi:MAG: type II toxin-antitoxin system RelE/ParE family toxin [Gemmatimonadaceae bacterium]|nr:type II toxin-antitoxin system RelE/ParE family toxin [Gemmatimonadaceae bacterium]
MRDVRIRARARAEIVEAVEWYEARSRVASAAFLDALDVVLREIGETPERFPVVQGQLRRVLLKRFPYAVYYKVYPNTISIVGVIHGRRHPSTWVRHAGP